MRTKLYRIDPLLSSALPTLESETLSILRASVKTEKGFTDPLIVARFPEDASDGLPWLIDGHHRDQIADELDAEGTPVAEPTLAPAKHFKNRVEAVQWMLNRQNARRNWTAPQKALAVARNTELVATAEADAAERKKRKPEGTPKAEGQRTAEFLAEIAGVSATTMKEVLAVVNSTVEKVEVKAEALGLIEAGGNSKEARSIVKAQEGAERRKKRNEEARNNYPPQAYIEGDGWENTIKCGNNIQVLELMPAVDNPVLIFYSPPYPTPHVKYKFYTYRDYKTWKQEQYALLKQLARIVPNTSRLVINVDATSNSSEEGTLKHNVRHDIETLAKRAGFTYLDDFIWYKQKTVGSLHSAPWGTFGSPRSPRIRRCHENIIIFGRGTTADGPQFMDGPKDAIDVDDDTFKHATISAWNVDASGGVLKPANEIEGSYWHDSIEYVPPEKRDGKHECPFPEKLAELVINTWSYRGMLVVDPFNGSGTTTAFAHRLGRKYLGIDIDPQHCIDARARLLKAKKDNQAR